MMAGCWSSCFCIMCLCCCLPVGLVLVNLAMEPRQLPARAWKVDGGKYRRGLGGFVGQLRRRHRVRTPAVPAAL